MILVIIDTAFTARPGIRFELEKSSADIRLWTSTSMGTELLAGQNSGPITFPGGVPASIWVEWDTPGIGTAEATLEFRLHDDVSGDTVFTDRLVFHPFASVVIVLGGGGADAKRSG